MVGSKILRHIRALLYVIMFWLGLANVFMIAEYLELNQNRLDGHYGFMFIFFLFFGISALIYAMFYSTDAEDF